MMSYEVIGLERVEQQVQDHYHRSQVTVYLQHRHTPLTSQCYTDKVGNLRLILRPTPLHEECRGPGIFHHMRDVKGRKDLTERRHTGAQNSKES